MKQVNPRQVMLKLSIPVTLATLDLRSEVIANLMFIVDTLKAQGLAMEEDPKLKRTT